jgi:hypothetical protein
LFQMKKMYIWVTGCVQALSNGWVVNFKRSGTWETLWAHTWCRWVCSVCSRAPLFFVFWRKGGVPLRKESPFPLDRIKVYLLSLSGICTTLSSMLLHNPQEKKRKILVFSATDDTGQCFCCSCFVLLFLVDLFLPSMLPCAFPWNNFWSDQTLPGTLARSL